MMAGLAVLRSSHLVGVDQKVSDLQAQSHSRSINEADFVHAWREELEMVDKSFSRRLAEVLELLYSATKNESEACFDSVSQALRVAKENTTFAEEVSGHLHSLLDFANTNSAALREAVIEWDNLNQSKLFFTLRFELMSRSFHQNTFVLHLLEVLQLSTSQATSTASTTPNVVSPTSSPPLGSTPAPNSWLPNLVSELVKLESIVQSTSGDLLKHLVAHRGFHCTTDRVHRPIENTLQALEQAWVHGLHYCECDITLTLDGQIVLAHDTTLHRLSLFPNSSKSVVPIHTITFRDMIASPLKSGVRPALLQDVLESASRLGTSEQPAQLVIELKHGTPSTPQALVRFFAANPSYLSHVAVIMSFDLEMIHDFAQRIQQLNWSLHANDEVDDTTAWPKVMFLTCAPGRKEYPHELEVGLDEPGLLRSLLERPTSKLDGAYVEFESSMLESGSRGQQQLRDLCTSMTMGVWGAKPDNALTAKTIADLGVKFVNTDLPSTFAHPSGFVYGI
eukprot:c4778_g1_i1.p1 GENE.c4778_g1_i1~~c4778_g1_i1.p1  ORF type:complete len:507 (-),score=85.04 c4778_g1_i1:245-1765(-)